MDQILNNISNKKVSFSEPKINKDEEIYLKPRKKQNQPQQDPKKKNRIIFTFIFWISIIFLHIILVYVIKPLCFILEIFFLSVFSQLQRNDDDTSSQSSELDLENKALMDNLVLGGWLIIILLPMANMPIKGLKIVIMKGTFLGKIYVSIIITLEIITNIPLTILYDNNIYSIFLFEEKGMKKLLNPWLVFFPTNYTMSLFEIFRNFLEPLYFFVISLIKFQEIRDNIYQEFYLIILKIFMAVCVIRMIGNFAMIFIRLRQCCTKREEIIEVNENKEDDKISPIETVTEKTDDYNKKGK